MVLAILNEFNAYSALLFLALSIIAGLVIGKIAEKFKIPAITGYILAGIIIGLTNVVSKEMIGGLKIISNVTIGFIAYSIGTELWLPKFKKSGKQILIITIFQAVITFGVVTLSLIVFKQELWLSLLLGAIATATAPAPIMMIVKKYKAKGDVTNTLIPVVGLDDGIGIIIFGVCLSTANALISSSGNLSIGNILLEPLKELGLSILVGLVLGGLIYLINRFYVAKMRKDEKGETYLDITIVFIFIAVALAHYWKLSPILTPMVMGFLFTNLINKETFKTSTKAVDMFTPPLMIAFFTMAGAEFDFKILVATGAAGVIYVISRSIGKIGGATLAAEITKAPKNVKKHLGLSLLPQGGVEIGLVIACMNALPHEQGIIIQTVVLAGIFIFQLIGPILTKISLEKSGEFNNVETEDLHF